MSRTYKVLVVILICFTAYYLLNELFLGLINGLIHSKGISHLLTYIIVGLPLFIGVIIINPKDFFGSLGLNKSIVVGFIFSLLCTLPMLIGYASISDFNRAITWDKIIIGAISAGFFEELYFRGVLFGLIYRYTRLGFIPSVFFGALVFASLHMYQSQDAATILGVLAVTFLGGIFFAWVYAEWKYNLWVPIFLHLFMNLFWILFSVGENALGGVYANVFRAMSIALIIVLTLVYKKRNKLPLEINRRTLWMKESS